ncbi:MAG: DUF5009 domain-containing protein [Chitinophagaceae bacterium]|nr:DUF5009 domain-containing protein [Chitinophagaceae bacterium]
MMHPSKLQRLHSLDALRGFDMFWIIGGERIFHSLAKVTNAPFWQALSHQFTHLQWNGFTVYDLIFPLFLFIAGVATPYSIGRQLDNNVDKRKLVWKVVKRGLILVVLGWVKNNDLIIQPISEMRFPSVLGRIGLAYMFANIIYIYSGRKTQVIWFCGLLLGYWLLFLFFAAPGYPAGTLTREGNIASYIDTLLVPGKLLTPGVHDPEGLVSTIPAIGTGLLGILAGTYLKNHHADALKKVWRMAVAGGILVALGQLWNLVFPINKNLWSSSFVLHVGGLSLLLLALFYYIIDIKGYRKWAFFFTVIGMNSILIYMSGSFIDWKNTTASFFEWLFQLTGEPYNAVVFVFCFLAVKWAFLYFMYRKKAFLRV